LIVAECVSVAHADSWLDGQRRRDQFGKDFGYFVYPLVGDIPGLGSAYGFGGSVLNMFGTDTDFTAFKVDGDFNASGYTLLDLHLIKQRLIFDVGYYDFLVAPVQYKRGMDSPADDYILPKAEGGYWLGQLTLSFMQRQFETYVRYGNGNSRLLQVLDEDGNAFTAIDTSTYYGYFTTLGFILDFTDDRLDARRGIRFETAGKTFSNDNQYRSDYVVMDYNLTGFIPMRRWDTLVFNGYFSRAHITRQATTDYETLRQNSGLGCDAISPGAEQDQCLKTERELIEQAIANNTYGTATALGGTQRLRSFDNGRFYAGNALFYGVEYRLNLTDEHTPFDIFIAKGIRTGIQLAFFAEQGRVADELDNLWKGQSTSYGLGFRLILSGVVIRADLAWGDEGSKQVVFINYPWSVFSVDNPG
jgi:hypothetical protein